ncbi:MAG: hypothetical protein MJZ85_10740 [Bacteroidales bacterium]|nr:hypothetical protein [Bacteroidales bacterium]
MKKLLLLSTMVLLMASCTTVKKTAKTTPIEPSVTQYPTVADLDVKDRVEKTTSWVFNPINHISLDQRKKNLIADVLLENNADVLVEARYVHKVDGLFNHTLTVSGYTATYKNFRNVEESDIKVLYGEPPVTVVNVLDSTASAAIIEKEVPVYTNDAKPSSEDNKSDLRKFRSKREKQSYSRGKGLGFHAGLGNEQLVTLGVDKHLGDRFLLGAEVYLFNTKYEFDNKIDGFTAYWKYYFSKRPFSVFIGEKIGMRFCKTDIEYHDYYGHHRTDEFSDEFFTVAATIGLSYKHFDLSLDYFHTTDTEIDMDGYSYDFDPYDETSLVIRLCYNFF